MKDITITDVMTPATPIVSIPVPAYDALPTRGCTDGFQLALGNDHLTSATVFGDEATRPWIPSWSPPI